MGGMAGADFFRSLPVVEAPVAAVLTYGSDVLSVMEKYAVLDESIKGKSLKSMEHCVNDQGDDNLKFKVSLALPNCLLV